MKQEKWIVAVMAVVCWVLLVSCSAPPASPAASVATKPGTMSQPSSAAAQIDPCSRFNAADAQAIMGVPMKVSTGHGAVVCMYEEATPKSAVDTARVSLRLNVRRSADEESRAWSNIKVIRSLKAGGKNISQLEGIGDEAWFDGHIEKGNVDTGGVLARKGSSDFALESATFGYRASADEIKKIAKRIAGELN